MPLFLDGHHVEGGVSAGDVADAHMKDLEKQGEYGVEYKRYWLDEKQGKIFCLVEAPDAETAHRVHREAYGLVADEATRCRKAQRFSASASSRPTGSRATPQRPQERWSVR